jgi:hypothetical protein
MKVLDIIAEGVGEHVFKWTFGNAAKRAFAESTVERVASDIFKKFTVPALDGSVKKATTKDVRLAVEEAVAGTKYAGDETFSKEIVEQVKQYHNTELLPALRKARKSKKTDPSDVKQRAADARTKLATLGVSGLINKLFWMYAAYDVTKSVQTYLANMDDALIALELGENGKDKDGDPGISLESFEIFHREQLGQLFLSIATAHPALFTKIPIFGWLGKPFTALGNAGTALWMYFTKADPSMYGVPQLPGQEPDENLREMIARYAMWQIADISWLPGTSGESLASLLGSPIKWTTDFVKQLWTATVKDFYGDKQPPDILLPTLLPDHPGRAKPQGAAVTPADADQNSGTTTSTTKPPYAKGDAYRHASDWEDIGSGYERHKFNGTVAKKLPQGNAAKDFVQNGPQRNPADWRDMGNGYEVNIKTKPNGDKIPFVTGVIQLKN